MNSVHVSVEVPLENAVHEITYDGVEIVQPPMSMSENLTKLAQRIDFSSKDDDDSKERKKDKVTVGNEAQNECAFKTMPAWPWESVRSKLRSTLTELSVLGDILQISSQKKYMVLDPIQGEAPDIRPAVSVIYKKKALSAASGVLISGAERIKACLSETRSRSFANLPDFHIELLKLRQNWRLRKMGNIILGDLSYKTAGSRFPQNGVFEVSQAEHDNDLFETNDEIGGSKLSSALKVTVPQELQGIAYIQVVIQSDEDLLSIANIGVLGNAPTPADTKWQQRLEAAQNVLFCRELFALLAREAVQVTSFPIPPQVVGNKITATLFPGTQLIVALCHGSTGKTNTHVPKLDQNHVLEHSLHQLLRDVHRQNCVIPMPHPASGQVGVSKKRRLAGPLAYDRSSLTLMSNKNGILEEIVHQAQHVVLRLRTMSVLDELAKEIKDPLVINHWASLNAVAHSCVRINLVSAGYDMTARTPLVIHVKEKYLKCILKDGKAINLSFEPQELRDLVLSQVAIHQVMALQSLSKCMGWSVLSSSTHLGVGNCEILGNAAGCLMSSPNGRRSLAVRSTPQRDKSQLDVFVGTPVNSGTLNSSKSDIAMDPVALNALQLCIDEQLNSNRNGNLSNGMAYKEVFLEKLEGKNFVNKIEMLMAVLAEAV